MRATTTARRAPRQPVGPPAEGFARLAAAKWKASGLKEDHAGKLGLRALSKDAAYDLMQAAGSKSPHRVAALQIPYFDGQGKRTTFYRIRFLEPLPGWAGLVEKPQRYWQPPGTVNEVYLPPILERRWADILNDATAPLAITEGELKAASACAHGISTIGLGGVDMWRSGKRGLPLLPALDGAKWNQRPVVIVYDSDVATKPEVQRAQNQLARALTEHGAVVSIAQLPPTEDGSKQGLDDFLLAARKPRKAFEEIASQAKPYLAGIALHEMNEEVVLIERPGLILAQRDGYEMSRENFAGLHYADRQHRIPSGKDGALKTVPTAAEWLKWPARFALRAITYRPGAPRVVDGHWNAWAGWGCEPAPGDVSPWKRLLDLIFQGADPKDRAWFERWCAYPLQHPGTKLATAAVLWGERQGTGKTFVGELLRKIYGGNGVAVGKQDLAGAFNSLFERRQFVQGEEITGDERKDVADALKTLITQEEMIVRKKYVPEYTIPTCANYLFTSNHPDAFFLADDDRRFFVHKVTADPAPAAFWDALHEWKEGDGPSRLFHHLLRLDLGDFNPRAPAPTTAAKRDMIDANKNDLQLWCDRLRAGGDAADEALGLLRGHLNACEIFTVEQLHRAFDPEARYRFTREKVGRALAAAGFPTLRFRASGPPSRFYAVRNPERWSTRSLHEWQEHVIKANAGAKF